MLLVHVHPRRVARFNPQFVTYQYLDNENYLFAITLKCRIIYRAQHNPEEINYWNISS